MLAESPVLSRGQVQPVVSHYRHLDFLRASAVLVVFFGHLINSLWTTAGTGIGTAAHFGVIIFFVHTSLVLFMSLERMSPISRASRFYIRRIFRIYPLAVVTLTAVIWLRLPPALWHPWIQPTHLEVVTNFLLAENLTKSRDLLSTMWSLPFEVQMYIVLPLLFAFRKRVQAIVLWVGSLLTVEILLRVHSPLGEVLRYFPCFISGLVAYWLTRAFPSIRLPFWVMPVGIGAGGVALILAGHFWGLSAVADSLAALSVGVLAGLTDGYVPLLLSRASAVVAKYSYGIYMAHLPLMTLCFRSSHSAGRIALFSVLAVVAPFLLYHLIEQPMIDAGVALSDRMARRPGV